MSLQTDNHLNLFRELITCSHDLFLWTYDEHFEFLHSNCPEAESFHTIFMLVSTREALLQRIESHEKPVVFINSFGLIWIAAPERSNTGSLQKIHLIGPAFSNDISIKNLEAALNKRNLSLPLKLAFLRLFERLPVISTLRFLEYGLMLHYCITEEKINVSDMQIYSTEPNTPAPCDSGDLQSIEYHGTWIAEQELLKFVEDGNLDYRSRMERLSSTGNVGKMSNGDPIRQAKNSVIVFIALCSRAAIRGGLSPEIAFSLSDRYLQILESCDTFSQISEINRKMLNDFIVRVHQCKSIRLSPQIQECCDYISLHLEENLNIEQLAAKFGYSKYYLSRKFKQETGLGIKEYINQIKIEKAKNLLQFGNESIQEISAALGFHSQSYFGELFHEATGLTPGEFRNKRH